MLVCLNQRNPPSRALFRVNFSLLLILCLLTASFANAATTLTEQRKSYIEAERLLSLGGITKWLKIRPGLKSYPLFPYLRLKEIRATQSQYTNLEISEILATIDIPIPYSFRNWWLKRLVQRGDWDLLIKHYADSTHTPTQCLWARAAVKTQQLELATPAIEELWLVNRSQPNECDPVFEVGLDNGMIDDKLIFERMLLTKARNDSHMTRYLSGLLGTDEFKHWSRQLNAVHRHPQSSILKYFSDWSRSPYGQGVIKHGITRMSRRDIDKTATFWNELRELDSAAVDAMPQVEKVIAVRLAWVQHQDAFDWLSGLPDEVHDVKSLRQLARSALATENWGGLLSAIDRMPAEEADDGNWVFWRAYALNELGDAPLARLLWSDLSTKHSYYGFLAADKLGKPYPIFDTVQSINPYQAANGAMQIPAVPRIREWLALNKPYFARRELMRLKDLHGDDTVFWRNAAVQFHLWKWHDGAIQAGQLADKSTLQLYVSYPSPYIDLVRRESLRYGVPEHWIFSIMHQESNFINDIRSNQGATGLMQLMSSTARIIANQIGVRRPSTKDLQQAEVNIQLGVAYFKRLLNRMGDNPVYALAGYNAGPNRSLQWQSAFRASDPAIWVETIAFDETRNYIKKILVNFVVYEHIHSSTNSRVRDYLQVPDIQQASASE